jgi:lysophospholipase L1-like esterase
MSISASLAVKNNYAMTLRELDLAVLDTRMFDLAYWPLNEASGTVVNDRSLRGYGYNGVYTNVTLGQPGLMPGQICPLFPGSGSSRANVYSVALRNASNWTEYGVSVWAKVANAGVWTDGAYRVLTMVLAGSKQISIYRSTVNNQITVVAYDPGIPKQLAKQYNGLTTTDWMHFAFTGSQTNNRTTMYYNGFPSVTADFTSAMTIDAVGIGANPGSTAWNWNGWLAHVGFAKHELSAAEVMRAATAGYKPPMIVYLGDSITSNAGSHPMMIYNGRRSAIINRATGGASIMANLAIQAAAAASDNADIIIIALGTNDADDAGITATYTAQLNALKASNIKARIYGMGILPRTSGGFAVANNPRIQAACVAAGCIYLDTSTWIVPATDTSDGVHPNAAGYLKITNQLLAVI